MSSDHGFGSASWWGFSPALDLMTVWKTSSCSDFTPPGDDKEPLLINILLLGAGDLRHVLQTVTRTREKKLNIQFQIQLEMLRGLRMRPCLLDPAHQYSTVCTVSVADEDQKNISFLRDCSIPSEFFVIEGHLECYARHMLFLSLLSQPSDKLGLREKGELFLELYGNSLVRSQTSHFLRETANEMIKVISDPEYQQSTLPILDVSSLKYRERDMLEGIFKFWRNPDDKVFDMKQHWDGRLRHYLGQRYDSRGGVFDWDYHMKLGELVPMIGSREYKEWRETGVAFRLRDDAPYEKSNRTLASGMIIRHAGERTPRRGYYGDIVNSPYLAYGVQCENKAMLKRANDQFVKSCQQICEYNMQSLIQLLLKGKESETLPCSVLPSKPQCLSNGSVRVEEVVEEDNKTEQSTPVTQGREGPLLDGSCKIHLLPLTFAPEIAKKAKFHKLFHCIYFSNSMVHHLTSGIESNITEGGILICETARYILDLKKEHKEQYVEKVIGMANSLGFKVHGESNPESAVIVFAK